MKHSTLILVILFVISLISPCHAQFERYQVVNDEIYITNKPNTYIYELPVEMYHLGTSQDTKFRELIETQNLKTKKIKNESQMRVIRFTNTLQTLKLNAYIVAYQDKLWIIKDYDVKDNSLIKERNSQMLEDYNKMTIELQALTNHRDSIYNYYIENVKDSISYYKDILSKLPIIRDSLIRCAEVKERAKIDSIYTKWYNSQPESTKRATKIIEIKLSSLNRPNSVGGCDYKLYYTNKSNKTIKYLYWTGTAYNRVDDPAYCEIRGTAKCQGRDVGPINPNEKGGGTWECVIYNNVASYIKLNKINIVYMDGTSVNIAESDINRLLTQPSQETKVDAYAIITSIMSNRECENIINKWEKRISTLERKSCKALMTDKYLFNYVYPQAEIIETEIKEFESRIKLFEKFLHFNS